MLYLSFRDAGSCTFYGMALLLSFNVIALYGLSTRSVVLPVRHVAVCRRFQHEIGISLRQAGRL